MKWQGGEESDNVEDRRGDDGGGGGGGGGGLRPGHMVVGGGTLLIMLVGYFLGIDPSQFLNQTQGSRDDSRAQTTQVAPVGKNDQAKHFVATILRYTEKVWTVEFQKMGKTYEKPKLVMFSNQIDTGCGPASSDMGPFYCPEDRTVYLDPAFFDELSQRLGGSKAEFSQAYVIAHEVGHHVQQLLGFEKIIEEKRRSLSKTEFNRWSVRLELQADYLAGVWAHYGQEEFHFIETGDVEEALKSANAIGDDTLQRKFNGRTSPQNYTHGTSAQRVKWYKKGLDTGDFSQLKVIFELPYEQL